MAQRYYYLVGGLGWFTDLLNLLFAFFLALGAIFSLMSSSLQVRPLTTTILVLPAVFLFLHIWRFNWVLRNKLKLSMGMAFATMYNFFSLGWVVTLACIQGIVQKEGVFLRTPKSQTGSRTWQAIRVTQWEMLIGIICVVAGLLAFYAHTNLRNFGLFSLLLWQGSLYLAAPFYSVLSIGTEKLAQAQTAQIRDQGKPILEYRAARWAMGLVTLGLISMVLYRFLPSPSASTTYTRYLPEDVPPQQLINPVSNIPTKTPSPTSIPTVTILKIIPVQPVTSTSTAVLPTTVPITKPTQTAIPTATVLPPSPTVVPTLAPTLPPTVAPTLAPTPTPVPPTPIPSNTPSPTLVPVPTVPAPTLPAPTTAPTQPPPPPPAPTP